MKEKEFVELLRTRNQSGQEVQLAIEYVKEFEKYLTGKGAELDSVSVDDVREYVDELIVRKQNSLERLVALARYIYVAGRTEAFIYFTSIIHGQEVLESISEKLAAVAGQETRERVFDGVEIPPLGSPPHSYPPVTGKIVRRLLELGPDVCHNVLADNHHRIPVESFAKHKQWLKDAGSLDAFLKRVHEEGVSELERYMKEGKVWYEQEITPELVEYVKDNQEVLSAVRDGEYLYTTKIPFAPKDWFVEKDPAKKRYYACHCPLARAAFLSGVPDIPRDWCYCSGGYHKLMFDVLFETPTEVELLESVLAGDDRCRFRIKIPDGFLTAEA